MSQRLQGQRILVTRPAAQAGTLAALIAEAGGEPVLFPLLEIAAASDPRPLQQATASLDDYALAIFISPNAVDFSLPSILVQRPWPAALPVAAIGPGTVAQLASYGIERAIVPHGRFDSEALLELPALQADRVAARKVLILRGNGGRELLAETLTQRGAVVDCVTCYQRSAPADAAPVAALLRNGQLQAVTISSSEGLRNLWSLLDADERLRLSALPVFVPHQRIAEAARALGLRRLTLTAPADAGIIDGLCTFNWLDHD